MSYRSQSEQSTTAPGRPGAPVERPNVATASAGRGVTPPAAEAPPDDTASGLTTTLAEQNEILDSSPPTRSEAAITDWTKP